MKSIWQMVFDSLIDSLKKWELIFKQQCIKVMIKIILLLHHTNESDNCIMIWHHTIASYWHHPYKCTWKSAFVKVYLINGIWYMVFDSWYLIHGIWYMVFDAWYLMHGIWCMVFNEWYLMNGIWFCFNFNVNNRKTGRLTDKRDRSKRQTRDNI